VLNCIIVNLKLPQRSNFLLHHRKTNNVYRVRQFWRGFVSLFFLGCGNPKVDVVQCPRFIFMLNLKLPQNEI